jgi:hypothetical protein
MNEASATRRGAFDAIFDLHYLPVSNAWHAVVMRRGTRKVVRVHDGWQNLFSKLRNLCGRVAEQLSQ